MVKIYFTRWCNDDEGIWWEPVNDMGKTEPDLRQYLLETFGHIERQTRIVKESCTDPIHGMS